MSNNELLKAYTPNDVDVFDESKITRLIDNIDKTDSLIAIRERLNQRIRRAIGEFLPIAYDELRGKIKWDNLYILGSNPVIKSNSTMDHDLTILREKDTDHENFAKTADALSDKVISEAMKNAQMIRTKVLTPLAGTTCEKIDEDKYAFVAIRRASLPLEKAVQRLLPNAKIYPVDIKRNEETAKAEIKSFDIPDNISGKTVFILDPMLATGGTTAVTINQLKLKEVQDIQYIGIIAAPDGIYRVQQEHPDIQIHTCAVDPGLNHNAYIDPGLGDFGDRYCGQKPGEFSPKI